MLSAHPAPRIDAVLLVAPNRDEFAITAKRSLMRWCPPRLVTAWELALTLRVPAAEYRVNGSAVARGDGVSRTPALLIRRARSADAGRDRDRVSGDLGEWAPATAVAAGVLLSLVYVIGVGGDFMSGRFLTAPFVCRHVAGDAS